MIKPQSVKILSVCLFLSLSLGVLGQTIGKSQPEVLSFPSISGDGMVDKYTGNLSYAIPLLVVPGPDGGYPITLGYTASPSVNNVPTWVGYNWNINTGAIVRNKRGIPDDFNGDILEKTTYIKDKWNIGIPIAKGNLKPEIFGADLSLAGEASMYYDNYAGFGVKAGGSLTTLHKSEDPTATEKEKGPFKLGLNFDSKTGLQMSPSLSVDKILKKKSDKYSIEDENNKNKGSGFYGTFRHPYSGKYQNKGVKINSSTTVITNRYNLNYGLSFGKHSPLGQISIPRSTTSIDLDIAADVSLPILKTKLKIKGNFSISKITEPYQEIPMYGSMFSHSGQANNDGIMDSYRDNDSPITKDSPFMPVTVNSFDVFSINAAGLGGSFRLYRNDVGQFMPKYIKNTATNTEIGADFGAGAGSFDIGADINYAHSKSYYGPWNNDKRINSLDDYKFGNKSFATPLYEPAYFKLIGEGAPLPLDEYDAMEEDDPIAFDIGNWKNIGDKPLSFKARVFSTYNSGKNNLNVNNKNPRKPRTTSIEYKTRKEVKEGQARNDGLYQNKHILEVENGNYVLNKISYDKGENHHINEITVRKSNGSVYNFALPAYNTDETKVVFATDETDPGARKVIPFSSGDDKIKNGNGDDEYYSKEVTPPYAHSYFLTSIHSSDYIDVKNDGYTNDDLGSWTKFIYTKVEDYHWRFPFEERKANFIDGYNGNIEDNKGTFTKGVKELEYLSVIETKTHIAVFDLDNTVLTEAGPRLKTQKYLKKISLYSKSDPEYKPEFYLDPNHKLNPIKEVHFNYDYSLKSDNSTTSRRSPIPNFPRYPNPTADNVITNNIGSAGQNGTLTLKELYFTYKKNQSGKQSRYLFDYNNSEKFPTKYSEDRWGNYQPDIGDYKSYENPYTYQKYSESERNEKAGLWCLNKVTLPSNGTIEIDYEKDDYKYVQDKRAMEYVRILGVGYSSNSDFKDFTDPTTEYAELKNKNGEYADRIYLDVSSEQELEDRIKGLKHIGFKTFMFLNHKKKITHSRGKNYEDYVSGYLEKKSFIVDSDANGVYLQINPIKPTNTATYKFHPFQIATIQYIRNYRPDLQTTFAIESDPIKFTGKNLDKLIKAIKPLFKDYIKEKAKDGWGKHLLAEKPSFLRLNTIDRKFGGDNRVKQVTLYPDPSNRAIYYGKEYQYTLRDGTSSGVAEMEPITGHEENGLVQPKIYDEATGNKLLWLIQSESESAFVETPFGTSFLPGANVGYSRVIERSLSNPSTDSIDVTKTQDGVTVTEFYTAKDYPTKNKLTDNPFRPILKPINVTIPFVGNISINNAGFTQGAAFTINNGIYSKQKRVAVYPYSEDEPNGQPVSEVKYVYKNNGNKTLNNKVNFLRKEGDIVEAYLGKEYDFYLEQYESGTRTIGGGVRPDIKFNPLVIPWPSLWPTINYMESTSSYISTTKVIYNSPILEKTIQYKDGAKVISSPEYYDYETGTPIINSVTNEFKDKIYTYAFPAQWSYPRMKGAYRNYGARLNIVFNTSSGLCELNPSRPVTNVLFEGDEVVVTGQGNLSLNKRYYVINIDPTTNKFELRDRQNNTPNLPSFQAFVERSAYRNLQSVKKGNIVSKEDLSGEDFSGLPASPGQTFQYLMAKYNQTQPNFTSSITPPNQNSGQLGNLDLILCEENNIEVKFSYHNQGEDINISFFNTVDPNSQECTLSSNSEAEDGIQYQFLDVSRFIFLPSTFNGTQVKMKYVAPAGPSPSANGKIFTFRVNGVGSCFTCEGERSTQPIIQTSAVEFTEGFVPNFNTLPSEETDISGQSLTDIYQSNTANPYAFGVKGIPRSQRTWAYIESRDQEGILGEGLRNDIDGQFDFYALKWGEDPIYNENYNWRWVNEVTQYNANGNPEEGKDRLGRLSSNLFGYKNLLVTAEAVNAKHSDIVFDGFEDYNGLDPVIPASGSSPAQYQKLNHGNIDIPLMNNSLVGRIAHTGNWALVIDDEVVINTNNSKYFSPENKKYIISAWVYMDDLTVFNNTVKLKGGSIEVYEGITLLTRIDPNRNKNNVIDGWIKIEGVFEPSAASSSITVKLIPEIMSNNEKGAIIDDIVIKPFNSTMKTYVYNPEDYTLRYILNNQNYYAEFVRDSEGSLIQKNIETEKGKKTLSINRNNISKQ